MDSTSKPQKRDNGELTLQFEKGTSYHLGHLHETASPALGLKNKGTESLKTCCK